MSMNVDPPSAGKPAESDYLLGPVRVEVAGRRLSLAANGERLAADTQQVDVLICLIRAYPRIVAKDELIEQVWGGRYVTDAALHKTVSMLRKLLRDQHGGAELIETRYRRGYQLSTPAQPVSADPAQTAADLEAPVPQTPSRSSAEPGPDRWRLWIAILLLLLLLLGLWWWRTETPDAALPEDPPPAPTVLTDATVLASLRQLDEAGLLQSIKEALVSDPELALAAIGLLRERAGDDLRLRGLADKFEGIVAYRAGSYGRAQQFYQLALTAFEGAGERREQANVLNNLAVLLAESGASPAQAEARYRESLALRIAVDDQPGILGSYRNLSNLLLESGDLTAARTTVADYESAALLQGQVEDQVQARILRGDILLALGEGDPTAAFAEALALASESGLTVAAASASQRLGRVALRDGDAGAARKAFEQALTLYRQSGEVRQLDVVLYNLATAIAAQGRVDEALTQFAAVLDADPEGAASALRVDARLDRARLFWVKDEPALAQQDIEAARAEALALQSDSAMASVLLAQAAGALREGAVIPARGFLVEAQQRLQDQDEGELAGNWRFLDILVQLAAGQPASARLGIGQLQALAQARRDPRFAHLAQQAEVFVALAEGDVAAAYRWHLRTQALPLAGAADGVAGGAEAMHVPGAELPWLLAALLVFSLGMLCGWALARARLQSSKPSANRVSP
jgi:DNA-binding winged helix-turn-helix (wHTH) protein